MFAIATKAATFPTLCSNVRQRLLSSASTSPLVISVELVSGTFCETLYDDLLAAVQRVLLFVLPRLFGALGAALSKWGRSTSHTCFCIFLCVTANVVIQSNQQ
jgi:hypothetical protein